MTDADPLAAELPGFTVAAVARRIGVAPDTLRTWDRRYGIGPSAHLAGAHRRYTAGDLARLEHMRRLVIAGYPTAEAARAARDAVDVPPVDPASELPTGRAGGGHVIPIAGRNPAARGLARAAQALDPATCATIIHDVIGARGVVAAWDELVVPVLCGVGRQWSDTGQGVEVEHALSAAIMEALAGAIRESPAAGGGRAVLLAGAPGELHSLALWAVAAALAEQGIAARILGASLPVASLAQAVLRLGPAVVFVWAQLEQSADPAILSELPTVRPAAAVMVGGPGWSADLPAGVTRVSDLGDTVARIAHALGE